MQFLKDSLRYRSFTIGNTRFDLEKWRTGGVKLDNSRHPYYLRSFTSDENRSAKENKTGTSFCVNDASFFFTFFSFQNRTSRLLGSSIVSRKNGRYQRVNIYCLRYALRKQACQNSSSPVKLLEQAWNANFHLASKLPYKRIRRHYFHLETNPKITSSPIVKVLFLQ